MSLKGEDEGRQSIRNGTKKGHKVDFCFISNVLFFNEKLPGAYEKMLTFVLSRWCLEGVKLCNPPQRKTDIHPEPVNVTLFGKRVFADVINLR